MGAPGDPDMIINLYAVKATAISKLDLDLYEVAGTYTVELRDATLYANKAQAEAAAVAMNKNAERVDYMEWEAIEVVCHATAHKEA